MNAKSTNTRFPFFDQFDHGISQFVNDLFPQEAVAGIPTPACVWELEDRYIVKIDLPGIPLSDINLQIDNGLLEVTGERQVNCPDNAKVTLDEQPAGQFHRRLRLAQDVDINAVDAELDAGVLTVTLNKVAQPQPQKVQIRPRSSVDAPDVRPNDGTNADS